MPPVLLFAFVIGYFILLLIVAWYTSRNANNESFFIGNRNSNWMLVAFGMIGTSLSGVTFVSVPGAVGKAITDNPSFSYIIKNFGSYSKTLPCNKYFAGGHSSKFSHPLLANHADHFADDTIIHLQGRSQNNCLDGHAANHLYVAGADYLHGLYFKQSSFKFLR
jgi:hypothetical protein